MAGPSCPILRLEYEPEIFTLIDGMIIQAKGKSAFVRAPGRWRWSIIVRVGEFRFGGDVLGYYELSLWESWRIWRALRRIKSQTLDEELRQQAEFLKGSSYLWE